MACKAAKPKSGCCFVLLSSQADCLVSQADRISLLAAVGAAGGAGRWPVAILLAERSGEGQVRNAAMGACSRRGSGAGGPGEKIELGAELHQSWFQGFCSLRSASAASEPPTLNAKHTPQQPQELHEPAILVGCSGPRSRLLNGSRLQSCRCKLQTV